MAVVPTNQPHESNQLLQNNNTTSIPRNLTEGLMERSANLIEFQLPYECLVTVFKSIQNLRRIFDDDLGRTHELLASINSYVFKKHNYFTRLLEEGKRDLEAIEEFENSQVTRSTLELERTEILFQILNRKNVRANLQAVRQIEKEKAEKKREGVKKTDGSQKVLVHIQAMLEIMKNGEIQTVVSTYNNLNERLSHIESFIVDIENLGNLLKLEALNCSQILDLFPVILEIFKEFSENYGNLANIRYELEYHNKSVLIQEELARLVDAIYIDKIVEPYINAELSYINSKIESKKLKFIARDNVDKSERLSQCLKQGFECSSNLDRSLNHFTLDGDLTCSTSRRTVGHSCNNTNYSVTVVDVNSVSHNFSLSRHIVKNETENPRLYRQSNQTIRFKQEMEDLRSEYRTVESLKSYMKEIEVHIDIKNAEHQAALEYSNSCIIEKKKQLSSFAINYENFFDFAKKRDFSIKPELLNAIIGVYLNNASLKLRPGICNCLKDAPSLAVDIEASNIFKILLSVLINKGKVHPKSCCADPILRQLHHCKSIQFIDIRDFLLSSHISGTLKSSRNLRQVVVNGIRSDDIIDSFYGCIRGVAIILTLGEQRRIQFEDQEALAKIHTYQQIAEESFTKFHYVSLAREFRHFNL